ncbi:hypothetical protein TNIN_272021 [Trichonephila inaurata madagascariensis]|uniref:Uncharacterized protein n=1 Tax=Trichonephila inaurata madagascariensis TaxID=2747483 RepID=A0A8X6Y0J4_9ARAC|nr:hypothetical protein TNIN_272021 [Trichonephila inaurata madagascariensis]
MGEGGRGISRNGNAELLQGHLGRARLQLFCERFSAFYEPDAIKHYFLLRVNNSSGSLTMQQTLILAQQFPFKRHPNCRRAMTKRTKDYNNKLKQRTRYGKH